jgi:hypothetical protein
LFWARCQQRAKDGDKKADFSLKLPANGVVFGKNHPKAELRRPQSENLIPRKFSESCQKAALSLLFTASHNFHERVRVHNLESVCRFLMVMPLTALWRGIHF